MAVRTTIDLYCSRCELFSAIGVEQAHVARCRCCGSRFSVGSGIDWGNLGLVTLSAVTAVVIALALTVLIPGGLK